MPGLARSVARGRRAIGLPASVYRERGVSAFTPLSLFSAGEQGFYYDPSDFSTLFQDTAGTVPVTAAGQSVARINDKSGRGNHATQSNASQQPKLARVPFGGRRNLSTYSQDFSNVLWNADGTTKASGVAGAPDGTSSVGTFTFAGTSNNYPRNTGIALVAGQTYTISAWVAVTGDVSAAFAYYNGTAWVLSSALAATSSLQRFSWTVTAAGTPSLDTGFRFSYSGSGGTVSVWGFQVELGSTATAYQKVVSTHDVTETGKADCYYLSFDGTDDFLVTGTITPGVDKAQVFAGIRKNSDAATFVALENTTANGTLRIFNLSGVSGWTFGSTGTASRDANSSGTYAAPITNVLTGLGDIAGDLSQIRLNGALVGSNTGDQGTGNYLAYPFYIGRRDGTSFPFNGHIYSLIGRFGANLTTAQIEAAERWVANKTGVTI